MVTEKFDDYLTEQLKDPDFRNGYDSLEPQFLLAQAFVHANVTMTEEFWNALDEQFQELTKKGYTLALVPTGTVSLSAKPEAINISEYELA